MSLGWLSDLYRTYENSKNLSGKEEDGVVLLPVAHSTQNAQIEITIDHEGVFISAQKVDKSDKVTIIPVTDDSQSRSGNCIFPHPLCDKLEYIAGDYTAYTGIDNGDKFAAYQSQLRAWVESGSSCPKVDAVYRYICMQTVMEDLILQKVLVAENGILTDDKIETIDQKSAFVRFRVDKIGDVVTQVYKDASVFESYTNYVLSQQTENDLCYATGRYISCSDKHPAKIRNTADKAKLISSNDTSGFTYRGRFTDSEQIARVGYDTSQKAHNALRWLVEKQGFRVGEQAVVAWEIGGNEIVDIMRDSDDAFAEDQSKNTVFTNKEYSEKLRQKMNGYRDKLDKNSNVVVMALEAATTGRLSISYYKSLSGEDFLKRLEFWYGTCFWRHSYKYVMEGKKAKYYIYIGSPSPKDIAETAFGKHNDKLTKATIERLLPCIVDKKKIPRDIVKAAVERASNPVPFDYKGEYGKVLSITCALIRKLHYDYYNKEDCKMALDENIKNRSYLFGRLLATAQKIEEYALFLAEEKRDTSAERFFSQFKRKPAKTWGIIAGNLKPYISSLKARGKTYLTMQLEQIHSKLNIEDFSDKPLDDVFLLGYYSQLMVYNTKPETENNNPEN